MKFIQSALALLLCISITSCGTVTIRTQGKSTISSDPTYSKWNHTFLWGWIGAGHVNVAQVCRDRPVVQMQSEQSFSNVLVTVLTLGVYYPRNAYVWCGRKVADSNNVAPTQKSKKAKKSIEASES